jgi:predicted ATPase
VGLASCRGLAYCAGIVITNITIDNFKSLKGVDISLPNLAYFCGPNASGKTNFAEAFDFLSNTFRNGLSYAVAEKGGFYNICFRKQRRARGAISFRLKGGAHDPRNRSAGLDYDISFSLRTRGETIRSDFYVDYERYQFDFRDLGQPPFSLTIARENDRYKTSLNEPGGASQEARRLLPWLDSADQLFNDLIKSSPNELIYGGPLLALLGTFPAVREPRGIRVFRISTRIARQAGTPSVLGELGKHGDNLPSALDHMMLEDRAAFDRLQQWVRDVIPGLSSVITDYTETKQMGLFVQERGFSNAWYAEDLSDGTLMSIALFLALLDSRYNCVVIEEPENSLHPWILRQFLEACREMAAQKQILITTQSPLVVATASPESLFLAERNDGVTRILGAMEREPALPEIISRQFLDLGEYWLSGGLGAVPEPPGGSRMLCLQEMVPDVDWVCCRRPHRVLLPATHARETWAFCAGPP